MNLLGIGDNVVDKYEDRNRIYPGGNALNVAVMSQRNGATQNGYIGIVGSDQHAELIIKTLKEEKVDVSRVRHACGCNSVAYVSLNEDGDRVFKGSNINTRVTSKLSIKLTQDDLDYINKFDVIHTSINSHIEHQLHLIAHKPISFDFSTKNKYNDKLLKQVCPYLNFAFFSGNDLTKSEITSLIKKVHNFGVSVVCITRGEKRVILSCDSVEYTQSPLKVEIKDTMGAGDSFIAGFLTAFFDTNNIDLALDLAIHSAAETCNCYGAFGMGRSQ